MSKESNIFEIVGIFFILFIVMFSLYINIVLEPKCEQKGFAGVDSKGCYIYENGIKVYEKTS